MLSGLMGNKVEGFFSPILAFNLQGGKVEVTVSHEQDSGSGT